MKRIQNTHGKIKKRIKILYQNLNLTQSQRKFIIRGINRYTCNKCRETDYHNLQ